VIVKSHPTGVELLLSPEELRDAVLKVLIEHGVDPGDAPTVYVCGQEVLGLRVGASVVLPRSEVLPP
jgi:hypothetical protein